MTKYNRSLILVVCLLFISLLFAQNGLANESKKRILILNAYHQGYHWTDRIMTGITSIFEQHDDVELFISYMDTKRRSTPAYFELLSKLYASKYQFVEFDAIISSDDHALDFLLEYGETLFPGTPVVFSGLNDFTAERLKGKKSYTGIYESYDVTGTIELMLSLHPEARTITTITDETRSGNIFKSLVERAAPQFKDKVKINYLHNRSPQHLEQSLARLPENSLVLWAIYLRTPQGTTLSSEESVKLISQSSSVPTYCIWDVVGQGVVGGKITSPNYQGEVAAKIALRIIQGEPIENIPVVGSPLANIFDYKAMQRFSIEVEQLPEDSIIMDKPVSFYQLYRAYIWAYTAIIIFLITTIIFLIVIILLKRKRDKYLGMAMHDQLTGLYSRYFLEETVSQKLSEANRHQQSLSLLLLDLDHFKKINDQHGHLVGDIVLKQLAKLLIKQNRSEDIVTRIGGEEFVILLNHCSLSEAEAKAEKIREMVCQLNPNEIPITISIGVTQLQTQDETLSVLLGRADKALYLAKKNGRNKVEICS